MPVPGTDFDPAENPPDAGEHRMLAAARAGDAQWGFDYAWQSLSIADLVSLLQFNGAQFAVRYINDGVPGGKGLTAAEAAALQAAGITICPVYETTGADFTGGYSAGLAAGQNAAADMRSRGAPAGSLCWFAIDTGTSDFRSTNDYLSGAKASSGEYVSQLYGSFAVVEAAYAAGLGSLHWQTYAWSAGKVSAYALLYQYQNGVMVGGVSMDRDRTLQDGLSGPWAHSGSSPAPPVPAPDAPVHAPAFPYPAGDYLAVESADTHCHSGFNAGDRPHIAVWQAQMSLRGWAIAVDGMFGPQSASVCRQFQEEKNLSVDGKAGPVTWTAAWSAAMT